MEGQPFAEHGWTSAFLQINPSARQRRQAQRGALGARNVQEAAFMTLTFSRASGVEEGDALGAGSTVGANQDVPRPVGKQ